MNFKTLTAASLLALSVPAMASAATALVDGLVYDLSTDSEFNYTGFSSNDEAADDQVTFGFQSGGAPGAISFNSILDGINSNILTFSAMWSSGANGTGDVYAMESVVVDGPLAAILNFSTDFSVGDPQWLTISWNDEGLSNDALINIEVGATPIPLPAAGWLLIGGLGGLAAMKRRKKA